VWTILMFEAWRRRWMERVSTGRQGSETKLAPVLLGE
jgi:hypothetical protein